MVVVGSSDGSSSSSKGNLNDDTIMPRAAGTNKCLLHLCDSASGVSLHGNTTHVMKSLFSLLPLTSDTSDSLNTKTCEPLTTRHGTHRSRENLRALVSSDCDANDTSDTNDTTRSPVTYDKLCFAL